MKSHLAIRQQGSVQQPCWFTSCVCVIVVDRSFCLATNGRLAVMSAMHSSVCHTASCPALAATLASKDNNTQKTEARSDHPCLLLLIVWLPDSWPPHVSRERGWFRHFQLRRERKQNNKSSKGNEVGSTQMCVCHANNKQKSTAKKMGSKKRIFNQKKMGSMAISDVMPWCCCHAMQHATAWVIACRLMGHRR